MSRFSPFREELELKPEEHALFCELFRGIAGLSLGPQSRFSMERRLRDRVVALNLKSFSEYYQVLRFHPHARAEMEEAIDAMTTHETYFFREDYQLRAFQGELLPQLVKEKKTTRRLSIWSAGCSTGEEAYTIAMLILASGLAEGWDVRVYGSDISKKCVSFARRGIYGKSSFRGPMPAAYAPYFERRTDGEVEVGKQARALCHFGQMNLTDAEKTTVLGLVDAIFCRNVLIYLTDDARKRVISALYEQLRPGGVLMLGHSESLLNVTTAFELYHLKEDLVYKRPSGTP
jgi:chemotaxis protein methyltransferase CheR